jgi:hypothetical protein
LEVRTHNGAINFEPQPEPQDEAVVTVTMRAGGTTQEEAEDAMQAVDVYSERRHDGTHRLGWKWKVTKHPNWRAAVSFEIRAPGNLDFDGETHNGAVTIEGITGAVRAVTHNAAVTAKGITGNVVAVTHNGRINVTSEGDRLHAETHNGGIAVTFTGSEVNLGTHNGAINADLQDCGAVKGDIETHNGGVRLVVGENTSADLNCETHNGGIQCDPPIQVSRVSKRRLTGRLGAGGGQLEISTHNGSVRITRTDGTGST